MYRNTCRLGDFVSGELDPDVPPAVRDVHPAHRRGAVEHRDADMCKLRL
jgi:hypothetical protein